jgi:F0F1-type ATP synthase assembly protein I
MSKKNGSFKNLNESLNYFQKILQSAGPIASSSYALISCVFLGLMIGYYIDQKYSISPLGLLIGLFIGLVVGFYQLAKLIWYKK